MSATRVVVLPPFTLVLSALIGLGFFCPQSVYAQAPLETPDAVSCESLPTVWRGTLLPTKRPTSPIT